MKTRRVIASVAAVIALALAPLAASAMDKGDSYNPPKYEHPQTRVLPTL